MYVVQGKSYRQVESETGMPRSTITDYMQTLEKLTGDKLIRFDVKHGHIREKLEMTRKHREGARRAVSAYGWASLRATFCRLAIEQGVDEKEIIKAVGHTTFKTTMEHYNNPTRAHLRDVMKAKMAATAIGRKTEQSPLAANLHNLIDKLPAEQQKILERNLMAILGNAENNLLSIAASA